MCHFRILQHEPPNRRRMRVVDPLCSEGVPVWVGRMAEQVVDGPEVAKVVAGAPVVKCLQAQHIRV